MVRRMIAVAVCAVCASVALVSFGKDDTKAYVEFWSGWEPGEDTVILIGNEEVAFKGGTFTAEEVTIDVALSRFQETHTSLQSAMTRGGLRAAQVNYNIGIWTEYMTAEMYGGISKQQEIDNKRIDAANDGTEEAAEAVAELTENTATHMQELKGSLDSKIATVAANNTTLIGQMASAQAQKNAELEADIRELKANKGADASVVEALQAEVKKDAIAIAENAKAIVKLRNANDEMSAQVKQIAERLLSYGTYTNEMKRLSCWLGNTNRNGNAGTFLRPKHPVTGADYGDDATINDYLSDVGLVAYVSQAALEKFAATGAVPPAMNYDRRFMDDVDQQTARTNVLASFSAPKSWADGYSVFCTDGVYRVKEPITWITNITENIDASTAITNIFNSVDNRTFVTNIVMNYKSSITNFYSIVGIARDGEESPSIPAENDPYSGEYEHDERKDALLPVQNALNIVSITNAPYSMIAPNVLFDEASVWTNGDSLAEIAGFSTDGIDDPFTFGDNYFPVRRTDLGEDPVIVWYRFPWECTNTVDITTNDLAEIKRWLARIEEKNIFNVVITNAEKFAEMRTNFFSQVQAETMLDGVSVWTNGEKKVEMMGFKDAAISTFPVKNVVGGERKVEWMHTPKDDASVKMHFDPSKNRLRSIGHADGVGEYGATNVWSVYGFSDAANHGVPYVKIDANNNKEVAWTDVPSGVTAQNKKVLTFDGTDVAWGDGQATSPDNVTISTNETGHVNTLSLNGAFNSSNFGRIVKIADNGGIGFVETEDIEVVSDVEYDTTTHQLTVTKKTVTVIKSDNEPHDETVFTARKRSDR